MSYWRGHKIVEKGGEFLYVDNLKPVSGNLRPCGKCGLENTKEGHDACLGELPKVFNACCGHGVVQEAYVQYLNGNISRGQKALDDIGDLLWAR